MQATRSAPGSTVNDDLLRFVLDSPPRWFWPATVGLGLGIGAGAVAVALMVVYGIGLLAKSNTQMWTVQIATFIYWAGVSHAGIMITAILRLSQAEWRRPITRAAEALTIFSLAAAAIFPITHTGRPWRTIYWVFPYDFARNLWPNVRSALIWDAFAIVSYLLGVLLFAYVALIPDLALARDRAGGRRGRLYGLLALGFRGTTRQWELQKLAAFLLPTFILAVYVSDHAAVAWDLSMALVPGWHSTVFGPYFLAGSVYSGVAAVATVMAVFRRALHLERYITADHFDALGRLLLPISLTWAFLWLVDLYFGLYGRDPIELAVWELRLFTPPWSVLYPIFLLTTLVLPLPIWLVRRFRRNVGLVFGASLLVNVGMWLERYITVITPLSWKQPFVFTWVTGYEPRPIEYALMAATVALVSLGILLFAKLFPIVPLYEVKEGQLLRREVRVGRARLPAVVRATTEEESMS
jgi:Ni/Fe-hydrogenase subunit HybB-like protein